MPKKRQTSGHDKRKAARRSKTRSAARNRLEERRRPPEALNSEARGREMADLADQERQRLGRELHDTISQELTAIGVLLVTLRGMGLSEGAQIEVLDKLEASIEQAKRQIRALTKGLFPVDVDAQGLRIAVEELVRETESLFRIPCRFECDEDVELADNFTATQLFLIAREAVQNAARHAHPRHIVVQLQDAGRIRLSVEDDGKGLPADIEGNAGMGLRIMRYRAELIGGKLHFESARGSTRVSLFLQTK